MTALEVRSAKRNRVYVRRFDHDEAKRRHAAGETITALAAKYGVTPSAVRFVVYPKTRSREVEQRKQRETTPCEECGGPSRVSGPTYDGRRLCRICRPKTRRTRYRFEDGVLVAVRCCRGGSCAAGDPWQPLANFSGGRSAKDIRPKGIDRRCRTCSTRDRRDLRRRTAALAGRQPPG